MLIIFLALKIFFRFEKYALEDIEYIMIFLKIPICFLCYSVFCFRTVSGNNNNLFKIYKSINIFFIYSDIFKKVITDL